MVRTKKRKKPVLTAKTADKHILYQESVQAPDVDAKFMARQYKKIHGEPMRVFREDFCGTFTLSCHIVKLDDEMQAIGVDLDGPTLDWGREHNLSQLTEDEQKRIHLLQKNVLDVTSPKADLIAAMNFSYCVFKERPDLDAYVQNAYHSLSDKGVFLMDVWGGSETQVLQEEEKEQEGFTYVWDQYDFDPLTYNIVCKIHFDFDDGTRMKNAFVYDWRLWTIPDLTEAMRKANFSDIHVLWEGTDKKTNEGNGKFRRVKRGDPDDAWIAYVVGVKDC